MAFNQNTGRFACGSHNTTSVRREAPNHTWDNESIAYFSHFDDRYAALHNEVAMEMQQWLEIASDSNETS